MLSFADDWLLKRFQFFHGPFFVFLLSSTVDFYLFIYLFYLWHIAKYNFKAEPLKLVWTASPAEQPETVVAWSTSWVGYSVKKLEEPWFLEQNKQVDSFAQALGLWGGLVAFLMGFYFKISIKDKEKAHLPLGIRKRHAQTEMMKTDKVKSQMVGQVAPLSFFSS